MGTVTVGVWQDAIDGLIEFIELVGQEATIQIVTTRAPSAGSVDPTRNFETFKLVEKMAFDTKTGQTTFDEVNNERVFNVTAYIEYIANVTSEMFVLFQERRFKIISVEDIGKINGIQALRLEETGSESKEASQS